MNCTKFIEGDLIELSTTLSSTDRDWMIENVNFIFHCAATVKFNEPIEVATKVNVIGTENILQLATDMKYLKVKAITLYSLLCFHCIYLYVFN